MREWWRGGVIYQVYPRSFQDSNGDGIGDLPGIMRRLDYIAALGVDAIWLSPDLPVAAARHGLRRLRLQGSRPHLRQPRGFRLAVERAHGLGLKVIIDQVVSHSSDQHPWFRESRLSPHQCARRLVRLGRREEAKARRPTTGRRCSAAAPGSGIPARRQYYFHNFLAEQPDLNFHNPAVQDAVLDVMRFWLERGVDGFRLDTVNYFFHDAQLRNNPPARRKKHLPYAVNPYDMQEHRYSKSQPENVGFLKRVRALLDQFPGTTSIGEVGDSHKSVQLMSEYTSGGDKLHMCYSFELLGPEFTAEHFRTRLERFFARRRRLAVLDLLQPRRRPPRYALVEVRRLAARAGRAGGRAAALAPGLGLPLPGRGARPARDRPPLRGADRSAAASASGPRTRAATAAARRFHGRRARRPTASPPGRPGCRSRRRCRRSTLPRSRPMPARCSTSTARCWPSAAPTRF